MKTAAKVFTIIGMVFGAILILPLVFGGITLSKLRTATTSKELLVWGILDLFFLGIVAGVLVLLIKDEDLVPAKQVEAPASEPKQE